MTKRILCVDDEPNILQAIERQFHKQFEIQTAVGPMLGLQAIREQGPFAVVVSDLRMPQMDGIAFLAKVRELAPDTVRVMLTGQADMDAAIAAVNQGAIFQFLTKPCPGDILARALDAALEQYRLITAEKELLEQTLRSSIAVLSEILGLVNPSVFGRAQRIRRYVVHMARTLCLPDPWQFEVAAMLSQIGAVSVPPEVLDKHRRREPLSIQESAIVEAQARLGHDLVARIPRLEVIARMIANQDSVWPRREPPGRDPATVGGHLLKIARDFDEAVTRGLDPAAIIAAFQRSPHYHAPYAAALEAVQVEEGRGAVRRICLAQVRSGMVVQEDVRGKNGLLLLAKGQEVTESAIARLRSFAQTCGILEPLKVLAPGDESMEATLVAGTCATVPQ